MKRLVLKTRTIRQTSISTKLNFNKTVPKLPLNGGLNIILEEFNIPKWYGLLLDVGNENIGINLHKHGLCRENIVPLFEKYNVPKSYDIHFSDMDGHDIFVLEAVLNGGYRPRVIQVETNTLFFNLFFNFNRILHSLLCYEMQ